MSLAFPHPYYIIAPPYLRTSAGVRVLYKLADQINKSGASAYIYLRPHTNHAVAASPMDIAPFLTQKTIDYHFRNGQTPIVIYPETIRPSSFNPPVRVRYLLNYNNLIACNDPLSQDHYHLSYSQSIASRLKTNRPGQTLFLPVSDPYFFCPPSQNTKRKGACFYAGKYKYLFKGQTFPLTDGLPEITRDQTHSPSPEKIREMFQNSEWFYCYEDSALALEAMLCGCPTIFLPNEHFIQPIGTYELNGLGFGFGDTEAQRAHAKNTVDELRTHYLKLIQTAHEGVVEFVKETQTIAQSVPYKIPFLKDKPIHHSRLGRLTDGFWFIADLIQDLGIKSFIQIVWKRLKSGRIRFSRS